MVNTTPVASSINKLGSSLLLTVPPPALKPNDASAAGLFVSPVSVGLALSLLLNGATSGSKSERELLQLLGEGLTGPAQVNDGFSSFLTAMKACNAPDTGLTVSIANSVWAKANSPFKASYLQLVKEHLAASAQLLKSAAEVNKWCSAETRGKISEVIDEGTVKDTDAMLVNAVYFKGLWENQFKTTSTLQLPFTMSDGQTVDVPMMNRKFQGREAAYHEERDFCAVRLPYKGGQFSAVALLPGAERTVEDVLRTVVTGSDKLPNGIGSIRWRGGDFLVFLPRFKIECEMKLAKVLKGLGTPSIFGASQDFAGMLESPEPMKVDEVVHKVFIEVNEEGTEAAAVTAVLMRCMAAMRTPEFRFDRPFIFTIYHEPTNTLLFSGVVSKPNSWTAEKSATQQSGPPPGYPTA